ncbi:MAG: hypothetical protein A2V65_10440 [Deltaproteobacteria bacterium RBG_13_49_15]|nr:MAG: hypothetical protein A2V65_10440 [Deltaproteobacteria bacterium RBG_13_49_15]
MSAEVEAELIPKKSLIVKGWTGSDGLDITVGDSASIEDLNINFGFQKHYTVSANPPASTSETRLSVKVMEENPLALFHINPEGDVISSLSGQWQKRLGKNHTFSLNSARIGKAPQSIHIKKTVVDLELEEGIPKITYFESGLLGGSIIGSASVFEKGEELFLRFRTSFSALNPGKSLQGVDTKPDSEDLTIGGRISVLAPLSVHLPLILKELELDLQFSHIGPGAMREMLHILDPHEHNETIISIRRLLRTGIPRWIEINVKNGILSLNGEVIIKGVPIKIPSLERLNLSDISGLDRYEKELRGLLPLIDMLTLASRRHLFIE